jgi:hypothetical protein
MRTLKDLAVELANSMLLLDKHGLIRCHCCVNKKECDICKAKNKLKRLSNRIIKEEYKSE